jgi:hypothetical protein
MNYYPSGACTTILLEHALLSFWSMNEKDRIVITTNEHSVHDIGGINLPE